MLLSILKKYWLAAVWGIVIAIIAVQYRMIVTRDETITELNNNISTMQTLISIKDNSIAELTKGIDDAKVKIDSVNAMLTQCQKRATDQVSDLNTIDKIMCSDDTPLEEVSVIVDDQNKEIHNATKPISNTVNRKGIDFINSQFDAIK